jgi:ATP-dependent helicase/nuclease subunit B
LEAARVIVDYKSGSNISTRSWWNARPEQPQLPLYATAQPDHLVAVAFAAVSAKSVAYQGVARDDGILPGVMAFDGRQLLSMNSDSTKSEWQRLLDHWRVVIEDLAKQFADGNARVDPLQSACRYCHLATLCRVHDLDVVVGDEPIELSIDLEGQS